MKKLQNNFTTPEQSKRLLKLGVQADSADCYFQHAYNCDTGLYYYDLDQPIIGKREDKKDIPCWSVGRLMEIAHICSDSTLSFKEEANEIQKFKEEHKCETLIETVIVCITDAVSIGSINFSKLEE